VLTIFEYPLVGAQHFTEWTVELPAGAELLHFGVVADAPHLWARVDLALPVVRRTFYVFTTGDTLPSERILEHRATVHTPLLRNAWWDAWHIFEEVARG